MDPEQGALYVQGTLLGITTARTIASEDNSERHSPIYGASINRRFSYLAVSHLSFCSEQSSDGFIASAGSPQEVHRQAGKSQAVGRSFRVALFYSIFDVHCCFWVLRHFLTSQVISVASNIEREKSDKFCSEALISA